MSKELIYIDMYYEDYDFMDHIYKVMNQNGLWNYFEENYSDGDQELIDQTEIDELSFMICGRDAAYDFGYNLFDRDYSDDDSKGICYKNDVDTKSKYIADKNELFETFLNELISQSKELKDIKERYDEVCIGHDPDGGFTGSLHDLLFEYLFEDGWLLNVKGYNKIKEVEQVDFETYFYDYMQLDNHDVSGLIVEGHVGGGAWEGVFYDVLVEKNKKEDLKKYFVKEAETVIENFFFRCNQCNNIIHSLHPIKHEKYLDLVFCKKPCANRYFWKNAEERCPECNRGLSINVKTNKNYPTLSFCKKKCSSDYHI